VARYKLQFPNQVHTIMGNHDTAFICNTEVMKGGKEMNRSMNAAIQCEFAEVFDEIMEAMKDFLFAQALAVKCKNRIWCSHSLPAERHIDKFDPQVLARPLKTEDITRPGPAYILTWGRRHSPELLEKLAELLDVDLFVVGHQPQEKGYCQVGDNAIILASDHNHGCILPIDLAETYTVRKLIDSVVFLTSIA